MDIRELFRILVKEKGSDLIIKADGCPAMRVQGAVKFVSETRIPEAFAQALADKVIPPKQKARFEAEGEADCSYSIEGVGRFRANLFQYLDLRLPDCTALNLWEHLKLIGGIHG